MMSLMDGLQDVARRDIQHLKKSWIS